MTKTVRMWRCHMYSTDCPRVLARPSITQRECHSGVGGTNTLWSLREQTEGVLEDISITGKLNLLLCRSADTMVSLCTFLLCIILIYFPESCEVVTCRKMIHCWPSQHFACARSYKNVCYRQILRHRVTWFIQIFSVVAWKSLRI